MSRRDEAIKRSRQRRGGVPIVEYAISQWGDQRRYRLRRQKPQSPVTGVSVTWTKPQSPPSG